MMVTRRDVPFLTIGTKMEGQIDTSLSFTSGAKNLSEVELPEAGGGDEWFARRRMQTGSTVLRSRAGRKTENR